MRVEESIVTLRHLEERLAYAKSGPVVPDSIPFALVEAEAVLRVVRAAQKMLAEYPGRDHLGRDAELRAALRALEEVE